MSKYVLALLLLLLPIGFSSAYLPVNWNEDWAKNDAKDSDVILVGRVIKIERVPMSVLDQGKHSIYFSCVVTISVGKILKGKKALDGRSKIEICFGITGFYSENEITGKTYRECEIEPSDISLANTQRGYDFQFNEIYLLFLNKQNYDGYNTFFEPRSGPYSIGRISKDYFTKELGDGSKVRFSKKFISMGSFGNQWKKEVPLDEYLKKLDIKDE